VPTSDLRVKVPQAQDGERISAPSADLFLLGATLMWSLNTVAVKFGVGEISPLAFPVLRFGLGGLAMLAVLRLREGTPRIARRDVPLLLLTAFVGVTLNQACFVYALTNTGASDVSFLGATGPIVTAFLATAIGLERLGRRHWLTAIAGMAGVALIVGGGAHAAFGRTPLLGAALALGSVVCSSASALPIRSLLGRYTAWRILTYEMLIGSLLLLPVALPSLASQDFGRVSLAGWASLAYAVVCTGVLTNLLYFTAIGRVGPSRAAMFGYLQSLLGVLFAVALLGESVLPLQLVGGLVVIGSVMLSRSRSLSRSTLPRRHRWRRGRVT
jgi:drug/metabolite transporter (DMT)-like permease